VHGPKEGLVFIATTSRKHGATKRIAVCFARSPTETAAAGGLRRSAYLRHNNIGCQSSGANIISALRNPISLATLN